MNWRNRLTEAQLAALERVQRDTEAHGEFERADYCGAQDTFDVGTLKGVGRIYQQTFIDRYSKVGSPSSIWRTRR